MSHHREEEQGNSHSYWMEHGSAQSFLIPIRNIGKKSALIEIKPSDFRILGKNDEDVNVFKHYQSWEDSLKIKAKMYMVVGPPNSGKSTYTKYLMNGKIADGAPLYCLDIDCGQPNFQCALPGQHSLVKLRDERKGELGVELIKAYFVNGNNPGKNPDLYLKAVQSLVALFGKQEKEAVLVVNTCGWVEGLGAILLGQVADELKRLSNNLEIVHLTSKKDQLKQLVSLHKTTSLDAFASTKHFTKGGILRNKRILDFLSQSSDTEELAQSKMLTLCGAPTVTIKFNDVHFVSDLKFESKLDLLQAFNMQLVAGVAIDEEAMKTTKLDDCKVTTVGEESLLELKFIGFVRDVHFIEGLQIVAPTHQEATHLMLVDSSVFTLPLSLLMKTEESENQLVTQLVSEKMTGEEKKVDHFLCDLLI